MGAGNQHQQAPPDHSSSYTPTTTPTPSFSSTCSADAPIARPVEAILLPTSPAPWDPHAAAVAGFALAQSLQAAAGDQSQEFDGRSVRVENLHVHIHTQSHPVGHIREIDESHKPVHTNSTVIWPSAASNHPGNGNISSSEPSFALASCAEGMNFGRKFLKGFYRAVKHVDKHRHLITYTQSPSTTHSLLCTMTLGLSTKRSKHTIFLFDSGPPQHLAHAWPLHIHLREIGSLIQSLGASFEYTRAKVKKNSFSLYIFGIKQRGTRFSSQGMQTWAAISNWAYNLPDSADNATICLFLSSLGSSQEQTFGIKL